MPETVANMINDIIADYDDLDPTTALRLAQRVHRELVNEFRLVTSLQNIILDGINRDFPFNENWLHCWSANYLQAPNQITGWMTETSVDELDWNEKGWRYTGQTYPSRYYLWQDLTGLGTEVIGFDAVPNTATPTLSISGATNASPIVITTTVAHGLSDASPVIIANVPGNTAANTLPSFASYAKVTGYSTTTFALYYDPALSVPVVGNGAYISGGSVYQYPLVQIEVSLLTPLTAQGNLPATLRTADPYISGTKYQWAKARKSEAERNARLSEYEQDKMRLGVYVERRQERNEPTVLPFVGGGGVSI